MSENTNEVKNTKKFKPNIIDFLIVIAIIAAVVGIVVRVGFVEDTIEAIEEANAGTEYAMISFVVNDVNKDTHSAFDPGDEYKASNHKMCPAGVLETISDASPAKMYVTAADGSIVAADAPLRDPEDPNSFDRVDFSGVLKSAGTYDDEGYFLLDGEYAVCPGSLLTLTDKDVYVTVTVTDVKKAG